MFEFKEGAYTQRESRKMAKDDSIALYSRETGISGRKYVSSIKGAVSTTSGDETKDTKGERTVGDVYT